MKKAPNNQWVSVIAMVIGFSVVFYLLVKQKPNEQSTKLQVQASLVSGVIVPGYEKMQAALSHLEQNLEANCNENDRDFFAKDLKQVLLSWAHIEAIRFGPIDEQMGHAKTYFWPDKHNATARHLEKLKSNWHNEPAVNINKLPLTVTGLQALEFYLVASSADWFWQKKAKACRVLEEVASNHHNRILKIVSAWKSYRPVPDEPKQIIRQVVQAYADFLERIATVKVESPLQKQTNKLLEARYANLSIELLRENFANFEQVFTLPSKNLGKVLATKDPIVFQKLQSLLQPAVASLQDLSPDVGAIRASKLLEKAKSLRQYFVGKVPGALGVQLGFNAADGD